eukprot:338322-Prymnesium_polylepis.1
MPVRDLEGDALDCAHDRKGQAAREDRAVELQERRRRGAELTCRGQGRPQASPAEIPLLVVTRSWPRVRPALSRKEERHEARQKGGWGAVRFYTYV